MRFALVLVPEIEVGPSPHVVRVWIDALAAGPTPSCESFHQPSGVISSGLRFGMIAASSRGV